MNVKIIDPTQPVDYQSLSVPGSYACSGCAKSGIKLWRSTGSSLAGMTLICITCIGKVANIDVSQVRDDGTCPGRHGTFTDQIDLYVPAVPARENDGFYGYTGIDRHGYAWWRRLPLGR
ncbi:MAG TPA: hypothetical protein VD907_00100 [Verrucomicrobiae bacterium]|nr:hypothetical protein [Verrucomicrobiae bacterium]